MLKDPFFEKNCKLKYSNDRIRIAENTIIIDSNNMSNAIVKKGTELMRIDKLAILFLRSVFAKSP